MMTSFDLCAHLGRDKNHLFQKALDIQKVNPKKLKFPMWASEKYDGVFCAALRKPDGSIGVFSRTGEEYLSMEHLKPFYDEFLEDEDFVLFEAYIPGEPQSSISGACRDTKMQHPEILAYQHTTLYEGFPVYTNRNSERIGIDIGCEFLRNTRNIRYINHVWVDRLEEAQRLAEEVRQRGGEGIVLNALDAPYQPGKRNESMIKIKKILSFDLEVIEVYEGKGKYAGTLGGLVCRWKNGKTIKVSGMTDSQRKEWWSNPDTIIGQIVQIDAMAESSKGLLREPRFRGIRYDKTEGDY